MDENSTIPMMMKNGLPFLKNQPKLSPRNTNIKKNTSPAVLVK